MTQIISLKLLPLLSHDLPRGFPRASRHLTNSLGFDKSEQREA